MTVPAGVWGPYGGPPPAFMPFGWAQVNSDGTFSSSSGNLSMLKGSAGNYILHPLDDKGNPLHYARAGLMADAISDSGVPFVCSVSYGLGPGSDGIQVTVYNSETQAMSDEPFMFKLYTTGKLA